MAEILKEASAVIISFQILKLSLHMDQLLQLVVEPQRYRF